MFYNVHPWIESVWILIGIFWGLTALRLKPVVRAQPTRARLIQMSILISGAALLISKWPQALNSRVLPDSAPTALAGMTLTVGGAMVAVVARAYLGGNWSGRPTIKEGHELVTQGPYAFVRHPIYTGIFVAVIGTAIAFGQARDLLALPLVLLGLWLKARQEERLLSKAFGHSYAAYQQTVKSAIIPFVL